MTSLVLKVKKSLGWTLTAFFFPKVRQCIIILTDNPVQLPEDNYNMIHVPSTNHQFEEETEEALNKQLWNDYSEISKTCIISELVKQVTFIVTFLMKINVHQSKIICSQVCCVRELNLTLLEFPGKRITNIFHWTLQFLEGNDIHTEHKFE